METASDDYNKGFNDALDKAQKHIADRCMQTAFNLIGLSKKDADFVYEYFAENQLPRWIDEVRKGDIECQN